MSEPRTPGPVSGWGWAASPAGAQPAAAADAAAGDASSSPTGDASLPPGQAGARPPPAVVVGELSAPDHARYLVGGLLGRGGMGEVVACVDRRLDRVVARKVARDPGDPRLAERLAREARITARLDHPGIVPIYDAGIDAAGRPFYTMRLLRGASLAEAVAAAPDAAARLRLLRRLHAAAEAVAFAHSRGVVHRDLKPANVMLGAFGETVVVDWGLAAEVAAPLAPAGLEEGPGGARGVGRGVGAGAVVGTPGFIAPEVALGAAPAPQADVYALGATLAAVLATSVIALREAEGGERAADADTPPELAAIVRRACADDPRARYADAAAFAADVEAWLDGRPVSAHSYRPLELAARLWRAWRAPLVVALVFSAAFAALAVVAWQRTVAERDRARLAEQRALAAMDRAAGAAADARAAQQQAAAALASSLQAQALELFAAEALADAAEVARQAIAIAPTPALRGVLAGTAGQPTWQPRSLVATVPTCNPWWPNAAGDGAVCREGATTHFCTLAGCRAVDAGAVEAGMATATRAWLTVGRQIEERRLADGALLAAVAIDQGGAGWQAPAAADVALRLAGPLATLHRPGGWWRSGAPCGAAVPLVAALASDGSDAVVVCNTGSVVEADGQTLAARRAVASDFGPACRGAAALAWSADRGTIYVGCHDGRVAAMRWPAGAVDWQRPAAVGQLTSLQVAGEHLLVVGEHGAPALWHAGRGGAQWRLPRRAGRALRLGDGVLRGLDASWWQVDVPATLAPLRWPWPPREAGLSAVAVSSDGARLALGDALGQVTIARIVDGHEELRLRPSEGVVKSVAFAPDGRSLWVGSSRRPGVQLLRRGDDGSWRQAWRDDGVGLRRLVAAGPRGWIAAHYAGQVVHHLEPGGPGAPLWPAETAALDLSARDGAAAGCAVDAGGGVWAWSAAVAAGAARRVGRVATAEVCDLAPAEPEVAVGSAGALAVVGLAAGATRVRVELAAGERVHDVAWAPDGRRLAAGLTSGAVELRAGDDLTLIATLRGHRQRVAAIAWMPDGASLWSAAWDGAARRWWVVAEGAALGLPRPAASP